MNRLEPASRTSVLPWALGITFVVVALQCLPPGMRDLLRYEHAALARGELWRALTGHLLHLGWAHAGLNLFGLWLCCGLGGPSLSGRGLAWRLAVLGIGVSALLYSLSPQVPDYVGLSGILYGLAVWLLLPQALGGDRLAIVALLSILGWAGWQTFTGANPGEEALIGGYIVVQAHLYGIAVALVAWAIGEVRRRATRSAPPA